MATAPIHSDPAQPIRDLADLRASRTANDSRVRECALSALSDLAIIAVTLGICAATCGIGTIVIAAVVAAFALSVGLGAVQYHVRPKFIDYLALGFVPADRTPTPNQIYIPKDSKESIQLKLELIRKAQECIEFSPNYLSGEVGEQALDALEERMKAGVKVFLLVSNQGMSSAIKKRIEALEKTYPTLMHVQFFDVRSDLSDFPAIYSYEQHVKMLAVDGKCAIFGGSALYDSWNHSGTHPEPAPSSTGTAADYVLPSAWRDQDAVIEGLKVRDMRKQFYQLFALWQARVNKPARNFYTEPTVREESLLALPYKEALVDVRISNLDSHFNDCEDQFVRAIQSATATIRIANPYFCPSKRVLTALKERHDKGIKIELITNSASIWTAGFWVYASRKLYRLFPQADIYEYNVSKTIFHKKVTVIDGKTLLIGSFNLGTRSCRKDNEISASIQSAELAAEMNATLDEDKALSTLIPPGRFSDLGTTLLGEFQKRTMFATAM